MNPVAIAGTLLLALALPVLGAEDPRAPERAAGQARAPSGGPGGEITDEHGHAVAGKPYNPADYTAEERQRIDRLFTLVICACPKEGFTKTLAGCPDGCADAQKREVRAGVKAGLSDQEILAEQVRTYRTKQVLAMPDSRLPYLMPFLALGAMTLVVLAILVASVRPRPTCGQKESADPKTVHQKPAGAARHPGSNGARAENADPAEDARIEAAVEKDLAEMDE